MAGQKSPGVKPDYTLLPLEALQGAARVRMFGAAKYGTWNYQEGLDWRRLARATMSHIILWLAGEDIDADPEHGTQENHLDCAIAELLMLRWMTLHRPDLDDRAPRTPGVNALQNGLVDKLVEASGAVGPEKDTLRATIQAALDKIIPF